MCLIIDNDLENTAESRYKQNIQFSTQWPLGLYGPKKGTLCDFEIENR